MNSSPVVIGTSPVQEAVDWSMISSVNLSSYTFHFSLRVIARGYLGLQSLKLASHSKYLLIIDHTIGSETKIDQDQQSCSFH